MYTLGCTTRKNELLTTACSGSRKRRAPTDPGVSAALRAALTAELAAPTGSARPDLFFAIRKEINIYKNIEHAKLRRALIRAALTNRSSGSPLHIRLRLRRASITRTPAQLGRYPI